MQVFLSTSAKLHLRLYQERYQANVEQSLSQCYIADLHQDPTHRPVCGSAFPVQVTHGLFYSLSSQKMFTPLELLIAMGQHVTGCDSQLWPYKGVQASSTGWHKLSGNSMHAGVICTWLVYVFKNIRRVSGDKLPEPQPESSEGSVTLDGEDLVFVDEVI